MKKILLTMVLAAFIAQLCAKPAKEETKTDYPGVEAIKNPLEEIQQAFNNFYEKTFEIIKKASKDYKLTDQDYKVLNEVARYLNL